jgi:hypothetical protein
MHGGWFGSSWFFSKLAHTISKISPPESLSDKFLLSLYILLPDLAKENMRQLAN